MREKFQKYIAGLQDTICDALEAADGGTKFKQDIWARPGGGGGQTRVFEDGHVF